MAMTIRTFFAGQEIPRERVLQWELQRTLIVLKRLGGRPFGGEDLVTLRYQLLKRKLELGSDGIQRILRRELAIAQPVANLVARMSFGLRRYSVAELLVDRGNAEEFAHWFLQRTALDDETAMLAAAPDHFVIRTNADGAQEVIETTGGSPLVGRFLIDYQDLSSLSSQPDNSYSHQVAGVARAENGLILGGVRHQFRDEGKGFRAKLTVEFPAMIVPGAVSAHRWHLACEFANWIEAAFTS